jgi:hypothetical protein
LPKERLEGLELADSRPGLRKVGVVRGGKKMINQNGLRKVTKIDASCVKNLVTELDLPNAVILQKRSQSKCKILILYLNSATLFEYSVFILFFIFSRKKSGSEPSIFEPLVVENSWPTKRARQNGHRRQRSVQDIVVQIDSVVDAVVPSDSVLDVQLQIECILDDVVQTESFLDDVVQIESILDEVVQTESNLDAPVQTETESVMLTELNLSSVEVSTEQDQELAVGRHVQCPSATDMKKRKSMRVLCSVPSQSS